MMLCVRLGAHRPASFDYKIPTLGISEGWHYAPLLVSGALIALFSIEHIIALIRRARTSFRHGTDDPLRSRSCCSSAHRRARSRSRSACPRSATILYEGLPVLVIFQRMMSGMNVFSFLAIPFFIFAGELMLHGGIADKIVDFAKMLVGHVRGGLGMSNVIACTLFGGISGSPVADVSAMGSVMIPMMKKEGYDVDYAVNVTTHASLVGALTPTSHNMIIYSLAAGGQVSIGALILAGVVPTIVLADLHADRRLLGGRAPQLPARHAGTAGVRWRAPGLRAVPGLVRRGHHHRGHPLRRVHRHGVGGHRGALRDRSSRSSAIGR